MATNATLLTRLLLAERPALVRLAQRIVGNFALAEEVTQSLWLRIQKIADDPPILNQRAYLYRLTTNLATDQLKGEKRRLDIQEEANALLWGADHALAAERAVIARDMLRRIEATIAAMPEQTRRIFLLHRYDGLSQRECAERLGVSSTTIEKHMRRAMTLLIQARDEND